MIFYPNITEELSDNITKQYSNKSYVIYFDHSLSDVKNTTIKHWKVATEYHNWHKI